MLRQLMARAKERLDVFLREVDVMRGDLDENRLFPVRLQHVGEIRAAQRAQRLAGDHPLLVRRHNQDGDGGIVRRNAADVVEAAGVAVALLVELDAHAAQALQGQRAHPGAASARCRP